MEKILPLTRREEGKNSKKKNTSKRGREREG